MKLISHSNIGGRSSVFRFITIRTAIGYLLNLFTSLMYTIFTLLPWVLHILAYFSLYKKYRTWSDFSTKMQWELGTLSFTGVLLCISSGFIWGLYYLQSCLISGKLFFVIVFICCLLTIAAVMYRGFSLLTGISITNSSLSLKNNGLNRKENICWRGIKANEIMANRQESRSEGYIL